MHIKKHRRISAGEIAVILTFLVLFSEARTVFPVNDYGAVPDDLIDDGDAVRAAVAAAIASGQPSEVQFGRGTYRLAPASEATECVKIEYASDLVFCGAGTNQTELVFTDRDDFSIRVYYSSDVVLENFAIDYDPLPFTQGTVTRVGIDEFDIQLDSGYPLLSDPFFSDWDLLGKEVVTVNGTNYYDGYLYKPWDDNNPPSFIDLGNQEFTVSPIEGERVDQMATGDRLVLWGSGQWSLEFIGNIDLVFRHVNIYSCPRMVSSWHANENVQIDHISILPRPGTTRILSSNRDGMTGNGFRGDFIIEDCYFEALGDDYINIGSYANPVDEVISPTNIIVLKARYESFRIGDGIQIYDQTNAALCGQTEIIAYSNLGSGRYALDIHPAIIGVTAGMDVFNLDSCGAGAVIRNNRFMESRSRVLLRSHDVLVENNHFQSASKELIDIIYDYGWNAGIIPFNITIQNNNFIRPTGPNDSIIHIAQKNDGTATPDMSITNILIKGNTFQTPLKEPINFYGCRDVRIIDNTIEMTSPINHDVIFGRQFENISIEDLVLNDSGSLAKLFQGNGNDDVLILRLSGDHTPPTDYTSDGSVTKAEWLFDESSGATAHNSAIDVSETDGTLYGDCSWEDGCISNALHLSGADDYVAIDTLSFSRIDYEELTVSSWVKTTTSTFQPIIDFDDSEYWSLSLSNGRPQWTVFSASRTEQLLGTRPINDGAWHQLTAVFDHGTMRLYIDGTLDTTSPASATTFGSGTVRYGFIGTGSEASVANGTRGPDHFFYGNLDDTHIFFRALTAGQIQRLHDYGIDNDRDGLPNWWERLYFGETENAEPSADTDHDGQSNLDEYITGLDPINAAEKLSLTLTPAGSQLGFSWDSVPGRAYSIYQSTNLLCGFERISNNIPWIANGLSNSAGFFKLAVQLDGTAGCPDLNVIELETFDEGHPLQDGWEEWQNANSGAAPQLIGGNYVFGHTGTNWSQAAIQSVTAADLTAYESVDFKFHIKNFGGSCAGETAFGRTSFIVAGHDDDLNELYNSSGINGLLFSINHNAINFGSTPDPATDPRTWVKILKTDQTELGTFVVQSTNDFTLILSMTTNTWSAKVEGGSCWINNGTMNGTHDCDLLTHISLRIESWNATGDFGPAAIDGATIETHP